LLEEGMERGIEKGIERGIKDLVCRMAAKGKSVAEISDLTDLSVEQVSRILQNREL
jgi:predicted transposase/invertase (TIGR01784 family)